MTLGVVRAQHVRDREADIEMAKICASEVTTLWRYTNMLIIIIIIICNARRASPQGRDNIWVVFSWKSAERDEWRGPKGRAKEPTFVASDQKRQIPALVVPP